MTDISSLPGLGQQGCVERGIRWYWGRISLEPGWLAHAGDIASGHELHRAQRFAITTLRDSFISTRAVMRSIIGHHLGRPARSVSFKTGRWGKPYVDGIDRFGFSLSHTSTHWMLAISPSGEIGVDVEDIGSVHDWPELVHAVFDARELAALCRQRVEVDEPAFFRGWTRKEAVLKAIGIGLSLPPTSVVTDLSVSRQELECHVRSTVTRVCVQDLSLGSAQCSGSIAWVTSPVSGLRP